MKAINLKSLIEIYNNSNNELLTCYENYIGNDYALKIKKGELSPLVSLLNKLFLIKPDLPISSLNGFFVGYKIPQINKEFDLIRIAPNSILNIEYKRSFSDFDKVINQVKKNCYYLKFLKKEVIIYMYIEDVNKIFKFNPDKILEETSFANLIQSICEQKKDDEEFIEENLNVFFKPSDYLISPFNKTESFINEEYFLTQEQNEHCIRLKEEILDGNKYFLITGTAGSGKTLLTYHIAASMMKEGKNIGIIHCAQLNPGQEDLIKKYGWNIVAIKDWRELFIKSLPEIVIIDEIQRIYEFQFQKMIEEFIIPNNIKLIFSGDKEQTLGDSEGNIIENLLSNQNENIIQHNLKCKIRTNKEIANFIKVMRNLNKKDEFKLSNKDINITYFDNLKEANNYIGSRKNYKYLAYTPHYKRYNKYADTAKSNPIYHGNAHQVIGQEFDNVIVIMSENFYYQENRLRTRNVSNLNFSVGKMFYQLITRVINKLEIVVVNNKDVFNTLISLFNNQ